jgi:hypothetical protein
LPRRLDQRRVQSVKPAGVTLSRLSSRATASHRLASKSFTQAGKAHAQRHGSSPLSKESHIVTDQICLFENGKANP